MCSHFTIYGDLDAIEQKIMFWLQAVFGGWLAPEEMDESTAMNALFDEGDATGGYGERFLLEPFANRPGSHDREIPAVREEPLDLREF